MSLNQFPGVSSIPRCLLLIKTLGEGIASNISAAGAGRVLWPICIRDCLLVRNLSLRRMVNFNIDWVLAAASHCEAIENSRLATVIVALDSSADF